MTTSVHFNNFNNSYEQNLIEDLVIESIKIYGHDVYYMPRTLINYDQLYGESPLAEFDNAYLVEMYIKNVSGFGGDGDFLSKFNLQIRDSLTFTVARKIFEKDVGVKENIIRPQEGDVIYFPLNKKLFQIKFVEHEDIFYQMGSLQSYDIKCELFEYSNEEFNTGIEEIDNIGTQYSFSSTIGSKLSEDGGTMFQDSDPNIKVQEAFDYAVQHGTPFQDNKYIEQFAANNVVDFSEKSPFTPDGKF